MMYKEGSVGQTVIMDGKRYQISPGFWSSTEYVKGQYNGQNYDAIQRDISINHIAVVEEGRAGDSVKIKLDSKQITEIKTGVQIMDAEDQKKIDEYNNQKARSETPPPAASSTETGAATRAEIISNCWIKLLRTRGSCTFWSSSASYMLSSMSTTSRVVSACTGKL